jgi:plastocyanin
MRIIQRLSALVVASAILGACGGGGASGGYSTGPNNNPPNNNPPTGTQLTVSNNYFSPGTLAVPMGQAVTWTWNTCGSDPYGTGQTCVSHGIVFDDGTTSATQQDGSFSRTFTTKGTYPYHCSVHGVAMSGTITVQ